jgi:hypothetical protein
MARFPTSSGPVYSRIFRDARVGRRFASTEVPTGNEIGDVQAARRQGKQHQLVIAQDDLDSDDQQIQAERAPGFSGNSEDSVAGPDGDPGFNLAISSRGGRAA